MSRDYKLVCSVCHIEVSGVHPNWNDETRKTHLKVRGAPKDWIPVPVPIEGIPPIILIED